MRPTDTRSLQLATFTALCSQRGPITFGSVSGICVKADQISVFFRRLVLDAQEELDNKFGI